jgi:hypothetical protein
MFLMAMAEGIRGDPFGLVVGATTVAREQDVGDVRANSRRLSASNERLVVPVSRHQLGAGRNGDKARTMYRVTRDTCGHILCLRCAKPEGIRRSTVMEEAGRGSAASD